MNTNVNTVKTDVNNEAAQALANMFAGATIEDYSINGGTITLTLTDGDTITIEPWRSAGFPILKDLIVDRSALDRVVQAGGYISVNTGAAPEAHSVPVQKEKADAAFEAAACIGCGACVAACPNASAMLFTGAKISHLGLLPQGQPERLARVVSMLNQHDAEGFGGCTNIGECAAVCPKSVPLEVISRLNRDLGHALWKGQHAH